VRPGRPGFADEEQMKIPGVTLLVAVVMFAVAQEAHAYLDPGTGSMLIQGLIAAIAAAGVLIRVYWHRLLLLLGVRKDLDTEDEHESRDSRP
jgi:hypothetical protein